MCYDHAAYSFSQINFLTGKNGSGKSAILSGIVLALGGKPESAGRGELKELIKRDRGDTAFVTVVVGNRGAGAFKPEKYGDKIEVVRVLKKSGQHSIKMGGKTVPKHEVREMAEHFNIMPDNQVCVLNQDRAKQFLKHVKPEDMYALFADGTGLQAAEEREGEWRNDLQDLEAKLGQLELRKNQLEKEAEQAERKYKQVVKIKDLKDTMAEMQNGAVWARVCALERKAATAEAAVGAEEEDQSKLEGKIATYKSKQQKEKDEQLSFLQQLEAVDERISALKETLEPLKRAKKAWKDAENQCKSAENNRNRMRAAHTTATKDLERAKKSDALHAKMEARGRAIDDKEAELERLDGERRAQTQAIEQAEKMVESYRARRQQLHVAHGRARKTAEDARRQLVEMKRSKARVQMFGRDAAMLHAEVKKHSWPDKDAPIGPLGLYVTLESKHGRQWGETIEKVLDSQLGLFVVPSYKAGQQLREIAKRLGIRPPGIVQRSFESRFDRVRPPQIDGHLSLLECIHCSHDMAFNVIVDALRAEQCLLIPDKAASEVAWKQTNRLQRAGVTRVYSERFTYSLGMHNAYEPLNGRASGRLVADVALQLQQLQAASEQHDQAEDEAAQQLKEAEKREKQSAVDAKSAEKAEKAIRKQRKQLEAQLARLRQEEEPDMPDFTGLEAAVADAEEELTQAETQVQTCAESAEELRRAAEPLVAQNDERLATVEAAFTDREELEGKRQNAQARIEAYGKRIAEKTKAHATGGERLLELRATAAEVRGKAAEEAASAERHGYTRVETTEDPEMLAKRIKKREAAIANAEARDGDYDVILRAYAVASDALKANVKELEKIQGAFDMLQKKLEHQSKVRERVHHSLQQQVKMQFQCLLRKREFSGSLKFNAEERRITIKVDPAGSRAASAIHTKTMSGGEQSFTSACFILALWSVINSPFSALDELTLPPQTAMKMYIDLARIHTHKQYMFLSPLGAKIYRDTAGQDIKVIKLPDPPEDKQQPTIPQAFGAQ